VYPLSIPRSHRRGTPGTSRAPPATRRCSACGTRARTSAAGGARRRRRSPPDTPRIALRWFSALWGGLV